MEAMRDRGIREGLVERMGDILREMKNRVRVERELGEGFWMARGGMRQEYPLSSILFNLLIVDLEKEIGRVR